MSGRGIDYFKIFLTLALGSGLAAQLRTQQTNFKTAYICYQITHFYEYQGHYNCYEQIFGGGV
ncbi:hypothetical protein CLV51_102454 [Chitinophaga niastensis]|uniref:Uncharacterized protein n=1 Tax=Chitinophaga niastensis TaxID=536980 RepID=A0A2P8HN33_CHINA|nr:hypothetical protein CLV51_102454 [Chitinophaga niastensis]